MHKVVGYLPNTATGKIATSSDIDVDFTFGSLPADGISDACVLGFMATTANASDLKVEVRLNRLINGGTVIGVYGPMDLGMLRFFQLIFSGLKPSPTNNMITFKVVGGTGSWSLSNLVIWFRQNVA